jgi:beta-ribofuranosylaminobenzene 5'-phosphate synthase
MTARVVAPCRLHFGLLHVPVPGVAHWPDGTPVRKFGGVGLMIDTPAVRVAFRPGSDRSFTGSLIDRALGAWVRVRKRIGTDDDPPFHFSANGPPEHVGLGVGTALTLAVARLTAGRLSLSELSKLAGRGERSGIGVYGFDRGGFLLDAGKAADDELPTLHTRLAFPDDWRIVLIRPAVNPNWHGDRERAAFDRSRDPAAAKAATDRLADVAFRELAPAVQGKDFTGFADAVHRYNRLAGEPFAADQGGPYAGPEVTGLIETVRSWSVSGVGQSSWGPTVFAFAKDEPEANDLADRVRSRIPGLAEVTVTAANNRGATVVSPD